MLDNKQVEENFATYQKLYDDLLERMERLKNFEEEFKFFSKDLRALEKFYSEEWLEVIQDDKKSVLVDKFGISSQDAIWNLLTDHYVLNKSLLKVLADELNHK